MNIQQLIMQQQAILNAARAQGRAMTAEEQAEFERLQREIDEATQNRPAAEPPAFSQNAAHQREGETGSEDPEGSAQRAVDDERNRVQNILSMCREFGMDSTEFIANGTTVDQVRAAILENLRTQSSPVSATARVTDDEGDKFRRAASDAIMLRSGLNPERVEEGASQLRNMSLRDLAIECLQKENRGASLNRKSSDEIYAMLQRGFYNPEAAFPSILDQTIEKSYVEGHKKVAVTFDQFVKKGSLKDFKTHDNHYIAGPVGEFLEVPENGELKHDVFGDAKLPTRKLKTYGRQFTLSRKAFIDDDIALVTSLPARYAAAARKTQNKQVFEILLKNPTIYDGAALFGKAHKNLLKTGTGITQEAMQTMIMALSNQKDQFGESIIINPETIVLPSGMQFDMYTLFNSPTINTSDNTQAVNPLYNYRDRIKVVEDPVINAMCGGLNNVMPWFLFGSLSDSEGIEIDYLNGQEIPNIRRMEVPGQLGLIWDIYLDWGISVMDFRSMVKNPGTKVNTKLELA